MSYIAVAQLLARWLDEPAFRAELCADPEGTARRYGFELTDEEWAALRHFDWTAGEDDYTANEPGRPAVTSWTVWPSGSRKSAPASSHPRGAAQSRYSSRSRPDSSTLRSSELS